MISIRSLSLCLLGLVTSLLQASSQPSVPQMPPVPPPASAYIQSIVVDPARTEILYAASQGAGLFRSSNRGDSWESITPGSDLRKFNAIAIDPANPSRILTGGEDTGLWVSRDRGDHWEDIGLPAATVLDIAIAPDDPLRIYVLAPDGVYRTENATTGSWEHVFDYPDFLSANRQEGWPAEPWELTRFQGIAIDPHHPGIVTIGARWEGGYHRSEDAGETWSHETISPIFRRVDRMHFDPIHPDILYAATHHQGLFGSYNQGRSWVSLSRGLEPQKRTPHYGAVLISGLAFDPNQDGTLYAGSDYSNWKTTDGGQTWKELGITLTCEFARSFAVTPGEPSIVYAGTNVGIYRSRDAGAAWESCNRGLPVREILATCRGRVGDELFEFAAVRGRPGVFRRSLTHESDWVSISWILYEEARSIRFEPGSEALVIETGNGERRSRDGGLRWNVPSVDFAPTESAPASGGPVEAPTNGKNVFAIRITGAPVPDDSLVDPLYQRPPYVSLQLVHPGYPGDGSAPLWSGHWDRILAGTLEIPPETIPTDRPIILYVEVRDFQWGTRTGSAVLATSPEAVTVVHVN
ncbi:MAG: hypothetical protein R3F07_04355 [Opitutaceae bacterium]